MQWLKKREPLLSNRNFGGIIIECFHMMSQWPYCYQILPLIHRKWKGESTSLPKVTCGAALFQATLQLAYEPQTRKYVCGSQASLQFVVSYWWSKFTRMANVWNLGCMTEKKRLPVRVELARTCWPSSDIKLFMPRN